MYCAGTPRARSARAASYRDCSSLVSSRSGCAKRYARSQLRTNISRVSAFRRGDGTLSAVRRVMAEAMAAFSCTEPFHHRETPFGVAQGKLRHGENNLAANSYFKFVL